MRFSTAIATFALFAATASASVAPAIPTIFRRQLPGCADNCIAHPNTGGCSATDDTCLCNNDVFVSTTFSCIQAACTGTDLENAIEAAADLCLAVHVTLVSAAGAEFSATASLGSSTSAAPSASTPTAPASASNTDESAAASNSGSSPAPAPTTNGALSTAVNSALFGLTAVGALALAL